MPDYPEFDPCAECKHPEHDEQDECEQVTGYDHINGDHFCGCPGPPPEPCAWLLYGQTPSSPAEYCDDEAVEGQPYCAEHGRLADG